MSEPDRRGEFGLIDRYLTGLGSIRDDVLVDIGDDAAVLRCGPTGPGGPDSVWGQLESAQISEPLSSTDDGSADIDRCLTRLSNCLDALRRDGVAPAWATLALTLPEPDESWLALFSRRLDRCLAGAGVRLVGGDTTRGPGQITVVVHGWSDPRGDPHLIRQREPRV